MGRKEYYFTRMCISVVAVHTFSATSTNHRNENPHARIPRTHFLSGDDAHFPFSISPLARARVLRSGRETGGERRKKEQFFSASSPPALRHSLHPDPACARRALPSRIGQSEPRYGHTAFLLIPPPCDR